MTPGYRVFVLLCLAEIFLLVCLTRPTIPFTRDIYRYLFILDITQSMNTRDYHENDLPADRLSIGKLALQRAIRDLPCGTEIGIGLFSTKDVLLLIKPLEICGHFAAIDDIITHIDWRMAWSADSNIERGLYSGILATKNLPHGVHLVFMSDGEQNIQELHRPPLTSHHGTIKGFIFGIGGSSPSPIPKLDKNNRIVGFWTEGEVDEFSIGTGTLEPSDQKFSDPAEIYRSTLHESDLRILAAMTGLDYRRLESPGQFSKVLQTPDFAEAGVGESDIRWVFALVSGLLILAVFLLPAGTARRDY